MKLVVLGIICLFSIGSPILFTDKNEQLVHFQNLYSESENRKSTETCGGIVPCSEPMAMEQVGQRDYRIF